MRKGFTLIEILIVVSIIAVLLSAVLVGLGPAQRQGRDARRISDLRQTQNALELYYSKCGYYPGTAQSVNPTRAGTVVGTVPPPPVATGACTAFSAITTWAELTASLTGSNIGTAQIPNDPTAGRSYFYGSLDGVSYTVGATLEDPNNAALQNSPRGTINGVVCDSPVYCIQF